MGHNPLSREQVQNILADIRKNHTRRDACPRHLFDAATLRLGQPLQCRVCSCTMQITDAGFYVKGYMAAGGNPDDVWPGWAAKRGGG